MPIRSIEQLERFLEMPHEFASFRREPDRSPTQFMPQVMNFRYGLKSIIDAARVVSEKTGVSIDTFLAANVHIQWDLIRQAFSETAERLTDTTDTDWISKAEAFRRYGESMGIAEKTFYTIEWKETHKVGRECRIRIDEVKREARLRRRRAQKTLREHEFDKKQLPGLRESRNETASLMDERKDDDFDD